MFGVMVIFDTLIHYKQTNIFPAENPLGLSMHHMKGQERVNELVTCIPPSILDLCLIVIRLVGNSSLIQYSNFLILGEITFYSKYKTISLTEFSATLKLVSLFLYIF